MIGRISGCDEFGEDIIDDEEEAREAIWLDKQHRFRRFLEGQGIRSSEELRAAFEAPQPSLAELLARLATCAAALDHLAEKAAGEYKAYFADRAQQCRSWAADLKEGHRAADTDIIGGLEEFEALAL